MKVPASTSQGDTATRGTANSSTENETEGAESRRGRLGGGGRERSIWKEEERKDGGGGGGGGGARMNRSGRRGEYGSRSAS